MSPHIHVRKIIYKIIYIFSVTEFEKPKQHLIKATVIAEVDMYNLYDYRSFIIKGFYLLFVSQYSHLDIDRDALIKYRVSSVILFTAVVSDWCIMNLDYGWWINILLNLLLIYPPIK